jgi:hypothetical protein
MMGVESKQEMRHRTLGKTQANFNHFCPRKPKEILGLTLSERPLTHHWWFRHTQKHTWNSIAPWFSTTMGGAAVGSAVGTSVDCE